MTGTLELRLLGIPEVRLKGQKLTGFRSEKTEALLYYLAVTSRVHTRLALSSLFWGQWPDSKALLNLSQAVSNLRTVVDDHLVIGRDTISWNPQCDYWLDVEAVSVIVDPSLAEVDTATLLRALQQVRGDFLEGFYVHDAPEFEAWMLRERTRWREGTLKTLSVLADRHTALNQYEEAAGLLRRVLALEPWREEVHRQLIWLLALSGQRGAALDQYELCRRTLAVELAVEPSPETEALYQRIRQGEIGEQAPAVPDEGSPPALAVPPHNLPVQVTPFVGRTEEVTQILQQLHDPNCRLLTLVGPGGIGKTRLAIQVAQQLLTQPLETFPFGDGIYFVSLASVTAPTALVSAIADALNFNFYNDVQPRQQLLNYLQMKRMLLVIDNFEHLLEGADLFSEILSIARDVVILVTSREALRLREEWFHVIPGMRVPQADDAEIASPAGYDAIELFVQNARRTSPTFSLEAEQANVVRICQLVDGSPLAIELAAAWLKTIPSIQIVLEIERNLDILTTLLHNVSERHRSMRVVLEQSWELLTQREQEVLKRLSVFRGGFQQEPATQIAGASLLVLTTFIEKSLLLVSNGGRYYLHGLLRQFAEEKLVADAAAANKSRTQHSIYYLDLLQRWGVKLTGSGQEIALSAIGTELDNVRVGWHWAIEQQNLEAIEQTLDSLCNFYEIRSRYHEGAELLSLAEERLQKFDKRERDEQKNFLVSLWLRRGAFCLYLGEYETAARWFTDTM